MPLNAYDWFVIAGYLLINLAIGIYYRKQASGNTEDFFISGRNVSWWLAGTSMVATTFAADTPLFVSELSEVRDFRGNAVNWVMGCILIYSSLFGLGKMIFGQWITGAILLVIAGFAGSFIFWDLSRRGWRTFSGMAPVAAPSIPHSAGGHAS